LPGEFGDTNSQDPNGDPTAAQNDPTATDNADGVQEAA
jgi:hypothetical protein